jgi:alkanesulfonate monooxygenase SsuD/methylene tetrahydromethanopterin reductase-like flavin-dependent oxidoreductase (luciferase family)
LVLRALRCLEQFDRREQKRRSLLGVSPAEAQDRYSEVAEIVLKAMETTTLMYRGRQFSISDVPITPSPIQKPYPPPWFGTTKPETSRWAAENSIDIACVGRSNAIRAYPNRAHWITRAPQFSPLLGMVGILVIAGSDPEARARPLQPMHVGSRHSPS